MAERSETAAVFGAGVIQGVALVTFPAASTIFTSPSYYGFSGTAYGSLFLPQAVTAIAASLLGAGLTRRLGIKRIFLLGLGANLLAMTLLVLSQFVMSNSSLAYGILLCATASLGIGFGLTVPSLNTFAAAFFPLNVNRAVLVLNALLGLGTALAPLLVAIFLGYLVWWGLPLLVGLLLLGLILFSARLPLKAETLTGASPTGTSKGGLPKQFWVFAGFALLYGIVETMNGNWASLYMTENLGATATEASLALTAFWAMVTVGRLLFAAIEKQFPATRTFRLLPLLAVIASLVIAFLPAGSPTLGILAFGLAGLSCSALLPLTISFGQMALVSMAAAVAGGLIAFYQMGYGIAAFGVAPLENATGTSLSTIYALTALVALALLALAVVIVRAIAPRPTAQ